MATKFSKILVTGASGFVGRYLVARLEKDSFDYSVLMRHKSPSFSVDQQIVTDITNYQLIDKSVAKHDLVIHLACMALPGCASDPLKCFEVNVQGTENIARACTENGIPLIYISTSEVYGPNQVLPIKEEAVKQPISIYGNNKLLAEIICQNWARIGGLKHCTLRFFNLYGPSFFGEPRNTVETVFLRKALAEEKMIVNGGDNSRDFLFIDDAIDAIMKSMNTFERVEGTTINIGSGIETKLLDLAMLACELVGKNPEDLVNEGKTAGIQRYCADISLAKTLLNFHPKYALADGMRHILDGIKCRS